jgi:hypothetical protein
MTWSYNSKTQKLLDTINSFSNVAGYKINLQKSVAFLYTNNEQIEKEYTKIIPFTVATKKVKYLGVNLTKDVNDLYKENYKPWRKRLRKTTDGGKFSHAHGLVQST